MNYMIYNAYIIMFKGDVLFRKVGFQKHTIMVVFIFLEVISVWYIPNIYADSNNLNRIPKLLYGFLGTHRPDQEENI